MASVAKKRFPLRALLPLAFLFGAPPHAAETTADAAPAATAAPTAWDNDASALPLLAALRVTGAGAMTPAFSPRIFHYALRCAQRQTLAVSASAAGDDARLLLNGRPAAGPLADRRVTLAGDEDLVVEVEAPAAQGDAAYVVHCVPPAFPDVEVLRKQPGTAPGLLLVTPYYATPGAEGETVSHLAMLDDNGVPRFTRRVSPPAHNFRWHEGARLYSYNEAQANSGGDVVLLDERLGEIGRVAPVGGLAPAMMHEFLITPEGNHLFVSRTPASRDLGRYPVREDRPPPSSAQDTHDDIIQEVTPDGREVFRWNAWDHLKLSDCAAWRFFPEEYAKLNGLHLDAEGNLIASFRGCSQALKIERPSGRVLWQFGGSDPAAPDAHDPRRPTFERPWHQASGDPHGGFCAQHTVTEPAPGRILLFDNGQCPEADRESSRVVEYRLPASGQPGQQGAGEAGPGQAIFLRHYEPGVMTVYGGAATALANGNRLIAWGGGTAPASVSEVDGAGRELFALRLFRDAEPALMTYRVFRHNGPQPPLRPPPAASAPDAAAGAPGPGPRPATTRAREGEAA